MMAKTMKAAVVHEFTKPLSIEEVPIPEVGPGQILVKIEASGVCHTDLHEADGDWPVKPSPPFIPGHEGVGNIAAVGAGITAVKEGALAAHRLRTLQALPAPWLAGRLGLLEPRTVEVPTASERDAA